MNIIDPKMWLKARLMNIRGDALGVVCHLQKELDTCSQIEEGLELQKKYRVWGEHLFLIEELLKDLELIKEDECHHKALFKEEETSSDGIKLKKCFQAVKDRKFAEKLVTEVEREDDDEDRENYRNANWKWTE